MVLEQQGIWFIKNKSETDSLSQEDYILLMICSHQYKKPAKSKGQELIHCFQYIAIPGRICIKIQEKNVFSKLDLEWIQVFRWGSLGQTTHWRQRHQGGSGSMPPQESLKFSALEMPFPVFWREIISKFTQKIDCSILSVDFCNRSQGNCHFESFNNFIQGKGKSRLTHLLFHVQC